MVSSSQSPDGAPSSCLGLYLVRLEPVSGDWFPAAADGGAQIGDHIQALLTDVIRDSDIPVRMSDQEHLAILRDLDPHHTYTVSQRFLASASDSDLLHAANLRARVGYVIYPLSSQPNYPPSQWENIVELARRMSAFGNPTGRASGIRARTAASSACLPVTPAQSIATGFQREGDSCAEESSWRCSSRFLSVPGRSGLSGPQTA